MEKKWIHIALLGSDPWFLPVRTAIDRALREDRAEEPSSQFNELRSSLSLRLSLLPRTWIRIDKGLRSLSEAIKTREEWHLSTRVQGGYAFQWDQDSLLDFVADIDSLLFEAQSCVDLIDGLLTRAYRETRNKALLESLKRRYSAKAGTVRPKRWLIRSVLDGDGMDISWIVRLEKLRHFFIHEATPFPLVVELSSSDRQLVFLKQDVPNLDDGSTYVSFTEISAISRALKESKGVLQEHLIRLYDGCKMAGKSDVTKSGASGSIQPR